MVRDKAQFILFLLLLLFLFFSASAQTYEERIKANFVERFTRFIQWPELEDTEHSTKEDTFCIGVFTDLSFAKALDQVMRENSVINKPVKVFSTKKINDAVNCDIVILLESSQSILKNVLAQIIGKPILVISDTDGFGELGSHINFYLTEDKKVRFEINQGGLIDANLQVSYKLYQFGTVINAVEQ